MKKSNYLKVFGENKSLKDNINFINSFDFFNNCLIIKYIFTINFRIFSIKVWKKKFIKEINYGIY